MHKTTGRRNLGLALALTAAVFWGVLPIALKVALQALDPYTITWYRFAVSALLLGFILAARGALPSRSLFSKETGALLVIALIGLAGNYVLYLVALSHTSPTIAQTVIQLAPMFFLLGGLVVFKESFSRRRQTGLLALLIGLVLFFNRRLPELSHPSTDLGFGAILLLIAALIWAAYGLAQKRLLLWFTPNQILLVLYLGAILVLLPLTSLGGIVRLNALQSAMLAFCCLNTLVAYSAFAGALKHWEASRVGAILATAPLVTVAAMAIVERVTPNLVAPEQLNALSIGGTLLVVAGSALCAWH